MHIADLDVEKHECTLSSGMAAMAAMAATTTELGRPPRTPIDPAF